jgi:hypothetical protein
MKYIPIILKIGTEKAIIRHILSILLNIGILIVNPSWGSCLFTITKRIISRILKKIISEIVERGDSYPKNGKMVVNKSPNPIVKRTDKPTPKTKVFAVPILFNFNPLKIIIPGIKERKRNPKICLNKGTSNKTEISVISIIINIPRKNSLF